MNLRRIYAPPGYGKTSLIIDEIVELRQHQLSEGLSAATPTIIIAPQQYSYSFEAQLSQKLTTIADIDISYFNRLAQQILQEVGKLPSQILTTSSQFLLMHKAILEVGSQLTLFGSMVGNFKFTNEMIQLIKEFKQYGMKPELLGDYLATTTNERLSDLLLIYQQYELLCMAQNKLYDNEAILQMAIKFMSQSQQIAESTIYITDFYNFSELEYQLIGALIKYAKEVVIALSYPTLTLVDGEIYTPILQQDLELDQYKWSMWRKCYEIDAKLTSLVKSINGQLIELQQQELVNEIWQIMTEQTITKYLMRHHQQNYQVAQLSQQSNPYGRFTTTALKHISINFDRFNYPQIMSDQQVKLSQHQTLADEVATVCHDIIEKMQQDDTLSWDDFAIMYRDSEQYVSVLTEMAANYQIPLDISEKQFIKNHRLIRLLFKLLKIADNDWRRENILGVFKTGLVTYSRSIIAYLLESITSIMTADPQEKLTIKQWEPLFYEAIEQLPATTRHNWIKTDKELQAQFDLYHDDDTQYTVEEFSYQIGYLLTRVYDELDELENEIIKNDIHTKAQWYQPYIFGNPQYFEQQAQQQLSMDKQQSYQFLSQKAQKYEDIRQAIVQVFDNEQAPCYFKDETTLGQYIEKIYRFLQFAHVESRLTRVRQQSLTAQLKEQIDKDHQAWQKLMQLFEQLHQILANVVVDKTQFIELLSATLNVLTYDNIPIGQNYVMAGNFDRIQFKNKRYIYLLGINNQILPKAMSQHHLLTDADKEQLMQWGMTEMGASHLLMVDEELLAYRLLTAAQTAVAASYTISTLSGVQQYLSPYMQRLTTLFTDCQVISTKAVISLAQDYSDKSLQQSVTNYERMRYVNHYLQLIKSQTYKRRMKIADDKEALYNQQQIQLANNLLHQQQQLLISYQQLHDVYGATLYQALYYHHLPKNLMPLTAQLLYQHYKEYSVSRLETYNQSPYLYFLKYGLKLKPREQSVLDSARVGSLWHEVLADSQIIEMINAHTVAGTIPDKEAITQLVTMVLNHNIQADNVLEQLLQQQKLQYQQFIDLLTKVVSVEAYQHPFSDYQRQFIEDKYSVEYHFNILFDDKTEAGNQLKHLLDTSHIPTFALKGTIDRIDINQDDQSLQIIDYKSSAKELQWGLLASGQQLQLVTYLWMTQFIPQLTMYQPAGMYYFHLNNKTVDMIEHPTLAEQVKLYQFKGLTIADNDQQVLRHDKSNEGAILNIKTKKDGSLNQNSLKAVISSTDVQQLFKIVMQSIVETIEQIYQGNINLTAVQYKQNLLTYFNDYETICLFDEVKYPQQIRHIQQLSKDDVLSGGDDE